MRRAYAALAAMVLAATSIGAAPQPLTPDGWGDLRIGMSEPALAKRFRFKIPKDDGPNGPECREFKFRPAGPDVIVMTEAGRVTRLSVFGRSRLSTSDGLRVGSTKGDVQRVYGKRAKVEPNHYDDAEEYLTVWSPKAKRGLRFETDLKGVVSTIHVGGDAIHYVEGCL